MPVEVLEREDSLAELRRAVLAAADGHGSVVLVVGEAGIGKTSLIRAFAAEAGRRARLRLAACDDLRAPRTLGPLRDALALADTRDPFAALLEELANAPPTVLVVEDVHWADDATLDVLAYAARRIERLGAVLVLTFREDRVDALQRLLGIVAGVPHRRLALAPLTLAAVERLSAGRDADPAGIHRLTGGNPFFVSEVLAAPPGGGVPASVADAVLVRVARLGAACRDALDQLSVLPSPATADVLAFGLGALVEAETAGIVVAGPDGLGFRHEIARRAVEQSLPELRRRRLNAVVVRALRDSPHPDLARLMHHAAEAGDATTLLEFGPRAAREAAAAGSHRQALAHFEALLPYTDRLGARERAEVLDGYGWELYNAHRFNDAVHAGLAAAEGFAALGDDAALGRALAHLSRHLFMQGDTGEAERCIRRAVELLEHAGTVGDRAHALLYRGAILAMTGQTATAVAALEASRSLAARRPDLLALNLNYEGVARGDPARLRASITAARRAGEHEYEARGYTNLAEVLSLAGRLDELDACVREGLPFTEERGFWSHAYGLEVHRCVVLLRRGYWDDALAGLRALVERVEDPGMAYVYSVPWYGRLLARRGDPDAGPLLAEAWERASRQWLVIGLAYAGLASVEWAWLNGRADVARSVAADLQGRLPPPLRDELARYLARAGVPAPPPVAPAPADDPYERALELADLGDRESLLGALAVLEELRAEPAAESVRARLRARGVRFRRPRAQTRANPAGLTTRQLDVLALLEQGMTNADIAERLNLSVRTVDHHVAAVLGKLGVHSRREAGEAARRLGAPR